MKSLARQHHTRLSQRRTRLHGYAAVERAAGASPGWARVALERLAGRAAGFGAGEANACGRGGCGGETDGCGGDAAGDGGGGVAARAGGAGGGDSSVALERLAGRAAGSARQPAGATCREASGGQAGRARSGWWSTAGARRRVGRMACGGATVSPLARVCEHLRLHPERCAAVECVRGRTRAADLCTARGSVAHQANMLRGHRQLWAVPAARARDARTGRGRHATAGVVQVRGGRHSERARSRGCAQRAWTSSARGGRSPRLSLDLGCSGVGVAVNRDCSGVSWAIFIGLLEHPGPPHSRRRPPRCSASQTLGGVWTRATCVWTRKVSTHAARVLTRGCRHVCVKRSPGGVDTKSAEHAPGACGHTVCPHVPPCVDTRRVEHGRKAC